MRQARRSRGYHGFASARSRDGGLTIGAATCDDSGSRGGEGDALISSGSDSRSAAGSVGGGGISSGGAGARAMTMSWAGFQMRILAATMGGSDLGVGYLADGVDIRKMWKMAGL